MADEDGPREQRVDAVVARDTVAYLTEMLTGFEKIDADQWEENEALDIWLRLDELLAQIRVIHRQHGCKLADRLPDSYKHPTLGEVHSEWEKKERWDGDGVLTALSTRMAHVETGDIEDAVPTKTLRAVLPACGPNQISSKWKRTGLQAAGIPTGQFHEIEWGDKVLKKGPKYAPRNPKPPEGTWGPMEGDLGPPETDLGSVDDRPLA